MFAITNTEISSTEHGASIYHNSLQDALQNLDNFSSKNETASNLSATALNMVQSHDILM